MGSPRVAGLLVALAALAAGACGVRASPRADPAAPLLGARAGAGAGAAPQSAAPPAPTIVHEWTSVDFAYPTPRPAWLNTWPYVRENIAITGIKEWNGQIYVTVPRWLHGVPATLCSLPSAKANAKANAKASAAVATSREPAGAGAPSSPLLEAYPSWAMNEVLQPSALQYVQSMEVDSKGRMWILDVGRLHIFDGPQYLVNGPPKVVVWDIEAGAADTVFTFPHSVAPYDASFLNDLVVDEANGVAYISDSGQGGIVVYDYTHGRSRRWDDKAHGSVLAEHVPLTIAGVTYHTILTPSDGIALSPDLQRLYYAPLDGTHYYGVDTAALRDMSLSDDQVGVVGHWANLTSKGDASDGMTTDAQGRLYYGGLQTASVYRKDSPDDPSAPYVTIARDETTMQWVDTFAFAGDGSRLLFTTNRLQLFFARTMRYDGDANFRVCSVDIGAGSYLSAEPAAPSGKPGPHLYPQSTVVGLGIALFLTALAGFVSCVWLWRAGRQHKLEERYRALHETASVDDGGGRGAPRL